MRALLLTNPKATSTNRRTRDVLVRALGAEVDLTVEQTGYRGHAAVLAATAREKGFDVVAVLGGDGTINEAVNGMAGGDGPPPALIVIPGGSANVFARALGLPNDPVEATGAVLEAIREDRRRTVSLGQAFWEDRADGPAGRYFTFCAGMGYDAEVVRAVEGLRGAGYKASPGRYVHTALRHYLMTDRHHPALRLELPHRPPVDGVFMAIISNTAPWTWLGDRPVNPTPWAGFDTGLDLLGMRRMGTAAMLRLVGQIVGERVGLPRGGYLVHVHDEEEFTITAARPTAFQLDGDYLGECERVRFRSVPSALQVLV
ncbi:diacylglycerol kinase [Sphaerisporangium krabiense]|uniref:Diacylglycerol kinase family enzyme n=1 Tax=Sphaerisporangium krabiense TaxID=763782 RepID=A0A7W8Z5D1_9ACTN|nr:diacylglycerol kinase family protein [Sphaerisporangium krabiense]MBB5627677.1 diacylglycerol kinase family enzyme [Sphaerisporangium krabiense]GII61835.1 diacylglycerol kinase [Sphaerisporangium krabiense]